jgi:battenin
LPTVIQFFVLLLLSLQASRFIFASSVFTPPAEPPSQGVDRSITIVFFLMCLEGLCGGRAYVNTFYWVGREGEDGEDEGEEGAKRKMEKEFRIGATGASDSLGKL